MKRRWRDCEGNSEELESGESKNLNDSEKTTLVVVKSSNQTGNSLMTQGLLLICAWQIGKLKSGLRQEIGI